MNRFEESVSSYDIAIKLQPDDHRAWNNRGSVLMSLGQFEAAISSYEKGLELNPNDERAQQNLALAVKKLTGSTRS